MLSESSQSGELGELTRPPESSTPGTPPAAPSSLPAAVEGNATATVRPQPVRPAPLVLPPWRVLLHNDELNEMDFVVETISRLARLLRPAATRCMIEAHKKGVGLVVITHRERAEFLAEQLRSCRLVVTIEPVR